MLIVKMDEKGRIQLPHEVRQAWRLKPRQPLLINISGDSLSVRKLKKLTPKSDPLLRDMIERPLRLKGVMLTKKLLDKIEDEAWMP